MAGPSFDEVIERELDAARCVVVVWSRDSVQSRWCRNEASEGLERGVLVPVRIDDVRVPLAFRGAQTADLLGWPKRRGALDTLPGGVAAWSLIRGMYEKAIEIEPDLWWPVILLIHALAPEKTLDMDTSIRLEQLVDVLGRCYRLSSIDPSGQLRQHCRLQHAQIPLGACFNAGQAHQLLDDALAFDPESYIAHWWRSIAYAMEGKRDQTLSALRIATQTVHGEERLMFVYVACQMGWLLEALGETDRADTLYAGTPSALPSLGHIGIPDIVEPVYVMVASKDSDRAVSTLMTGVRAQLPFAVISTRAGRLRNALVDHPEFERVEALIAQMETTDTLVQ